jgi:hypothetical protein
MRSRGKFLMAAPLSCPATRSSYIFWRFSQCSALAPKKCPRRSAVSPVIARHLRGAHRKRLELLGERLAGMNCRTRHNASSDGNPPLQHSLDHRRISAIQKQMRH